MQAKPDPRIDEVLHIFFPKNEAEEFLKKYISEVEEQKTNGQTLQQSINTRTQIDLLVTFAEQNLSREKLISLLLHLGSSVIIAGEFSASIELNEKIVSITQDDKDMLGLQASAFLSIGEIYSRQAKWDPCFNYISKAQKAFEGAKDPKGSARSENLLGTVYGDLGDMKSAVEHFEKALTHLDEKEDPSLSGKVDINLGIVYTILGNFDEAISYFNRALIKFEKITDYKHVAEIKHNIGMVYIKKRNFDEALKQFDDSAKISLKAGYLQNLGFTYLNKAFTYSQLNDNNMGLAFAEKAMEIAYKLDDKLSIAEVYKIKGILQRNLNNFSVAENYLLTSLRINKEAGNQLNYAETCHELGILYKENNRIEESRERFQEALDYYKKINAQPEIEHVENAMRFEK